MEDKSQLIINKFVRPDNIPKFIKISNDTIINTSHIVTISREWINSYAYTEYMEQYSDLLKSVTTEYIKQHPEILSEGLSDSDIGNMLQKKFDVYITQQLVKDFGNKPEPWEINYKIKMIDGDEFFVEPEIYYQIMSVIGINMDNENISD